MSSQQISNPFCPILSKKVISYLRNRGMIRLDETLGLERQCSRCGEWWPCDTEFFMYIEYDRRMDSACRSCTMEIRASHRRTAGESCQSQKGTACAEPQE